MEDAAMVWTLQNMENIDELALLCGHACILLGNYNEAEKYFLQSSEPVQALYLRRDLMQWEQALSLAQKLKPDEIPFIAREYAQQLEFTLDFFINTIKCSIINITFHMVIIHLLHTIINTIIHYYCYPTTYFLQRIL